jgi:hypothetical protein
MSRAVMGSSRGTPGTPSLAALAGGSPRLLERTPAVAERICQLIAEAYVGRGHAPVGVCACRAPLPGAQLGLGGHGGAWAVVVELRLSTWWAGMPLDWSACCAISGDSDPTGEGGPGGRRRSRVGGVGTLARSHSPQERQPDRLATPVGVGLAVDVLITVAGSFAVGQGTMTREWAPAHPGLVLGVFIPTAHRWRH